MLFLPSWLLFLSLLRHTNVDEWSSYGKQSDKTFGTKAVIGKGISTEDDRQRLTVGELDKVRFRIH